MTTNPIIEAAANDIIDSAFNKVSRNPSDHETAVAWRDAVQTALAMPVPSPWRDIESAPKDGTRCLFFAKANKQCFYKAGKKDQIRVDFWKDTGFHKMFPQCPYTHWMPLPESPPS